MQNLKHLSKSLRQKTQHLQFLQNLHTDSWLSEHTEGHDEKEVAHSEMGWIFSLTCAAMTHLWKAVSSWEQRCWLKSLRFQHAIITDISSTQYAPVRSPQ